jgi:hypothetical protein
MKPLRSSYPKSHILNEAFRYDESGKTDIRRLFAKARKRLKEERQEALEKISRIPVRRIA